MTTEKEVTDLLINDNPDYKDPVMDRIAVGPDKGKEIQKGFKPVDITTQEGFNRNEARLLEIAQRIDKSYTVDLVPDKDDGNKLKVYIGTRVDNYATRETNIKSAAGPFTTIEAIKGWYLRNVKDKSK